MAFPVIPRSLAVGAAALLAACETQPTHEVLAVSAIAPRQVEVGERVIVRGSGFPQAEDIRRVTVTLTGTLSRPGLPACARPVSVTLTDPPTGERTWDPVARAEREVAYATSTLHTLRVHGGTEVEFTLTEALARALTACAGDRAEAPHATVAFVGPRAEVAVRVETMQGTVLTAARPLRGPRLDVITPWGRAVDEARAARAAADRTLGGLGLRLAEQSPAEGGLQIERVAPGSPADLAGLGDGDVMERLDGVSLLSPTDFRPAAGSDLAVVSVRRGDAVEDHAVRVATITRAASQDVVATAALLLVALAVVAFGMSPTPGMLAWLGRRLLPARESLPPPATRREAAARAWSRLRAAAVADGRFWGAAALTTALALPLAEWVFDAGVDLGVTHAAGLVGSLAVAALTARAELQRPTLAAAARGVGRRLAFEVPAVGALVTAVFLSGAIDATGVAAAQGGAPWAWYLFRGPALGAVGAAHLAALVPLAVDVRAAPRGLVRAAAWGVLLVRALTATVLLGGGSNLPGVTRAEQSASVALQMLGALALCAKLWALVALARHVAPQLAARHPALRTTLALRYLAPLAVIGAVVTLVGDAFAQEIPLAGRELLVAVASLATFGAVSAAAWFASRRPALAA